MYFHYTLKFDEMDYIYNYLKSKNKSVINFYIDFKNCITLKTDNIHIDDVISHYDELMSSIFNFLIKTKKFFTQNLSIPNDNLNFIFFLETGKSLYHISLDKNYKRKRLISDTSLLSPEDYLSKKVLSFAIKGLQLFNYVKNIKVFVGKHMEFDFLPYYYIKYKSNKENDINIILSSDKDHYQIQILLPEYDILQLEKMTVKTDWHAGRVFIDKSLIVDRLYRKIEINENDYEFLLNYHNFIRAIFGDAGDGIEGIKGIKMKSFYKNIYPEIKNKMKTMDEIYDYLDNNDIKKLLTYDEYIKNVKEIKNEVEIFYLKDLNIDKKFLKKKKNLDFISNQYTIAKNLYLMDYSLIFKANKIKIENDLEKINNHEKEFDDLYSFYEFLENKGIINNSKLII